jgi:hypothetical protein
MADGNRRTFIKQSAAIASVFSLARCAPRGVSQAASLEIKLLRAVGRAVLPVSDLGAAGVDRVVDDFREWLGGYEPVTEQSHSYITSSEIRYGPAHPEPRWASQLQALDLESERRHGVPFGDLPVDQSRAMISSQIQQDRLDRLPSAVGARHVAVGLLAFFYGTPEANDLCHRAAIGQYSCRGLDGASERPPSLETGAQP